MIQINFNMNMPESYAFCPLYDEEFYYCHGCRKYHTWEVQDIVRNELDRPVWYPLIEVKNDESERNN